MKPQQPLPAPLVVTELAPGLSLSRSQPGAANVAGLPRETFPEVVCWEVAPHDTSPQGLTAQQRATHRDQALPAFKELRPRPLSSQVSRTLRLSNTQPVSNQPSGPIASPSPRGNLSWSRLDSAHPLGGPHLASGGTQGEQPPTQAFAKPIAAPLSNGVEHSLPHLEDAVAMALANARQVGSAQAGWQAGQSATVTLGNELPVAQANPAAQPLKGKMSRPVARNNVANMPALSAVCIPLDRSRSVYGCAKSLLAEWGSKLPVRLAMVSRSGTLDAEFTAQLALAVSDLARVPTWLIDLNAFQPLRPHFRPAAGYPAGTNVHAASGLPGVSVLPVEKSHLRLVELASPRSPLATDQTGESEPGAALKLRTDGPSADPADLLRRLADVARVEAGIQFWRLGGWDAAKMSRISGLCDTLVLLAPEAAATSRELQRIRQATAGMGFTSWGLIETRSAAA